MHYCASCNKCLMNETVFFYLDTSYCLYCCPWNKKYYEDYESKSNLYLYEEIYHKIVESFQFLL